MSAVKVTAGSLKDYAHKTRLMVCAITYDSNTGTEVRMVGFVDPKSQDIYEKA